MKSAKDVVTLFREAEQYRRNKENLWQEIAERVDPRLCDFNISTDYSSGKKTQKIFDSTATIALQRYAAGLESYLSPATQNWQRIVCSDPDLTARYGSYFDSITDILFRVRRAGRSGFRSAINDVYKSGGAFGTSVLYVGEDPGRGIYYRHIPLRQMYGAVNNMGIIDTFYRKFSLNKRQAEQEFGEYLPEKIKNTKDNVKKFDFIHAVYPNEEYDRKSPSNKKMKFVSQYISLDEPSKFIYEGGYRTSPYMMPRTDTFGDDEVYGFAPIMQCLPDIASVNKMRKTNLALGERMANPPILLSDEDIINPESLSIPNGFVYGGLDPDSGEQRAKALQLPGNVNIAYEEQDQCRKAIEWALFIPLFQIFEETPQMTATEVMARTQEKSALLAPLSGRYQTELFNPMTDRELDLLERAGQFGEMPEELQRALQSDEASITLEYESPSMKSQKMEQGVGMLNTVQACASLIQMDPTLAQIFNTEKMVRHLADFNSTPADILKTEEEMAAARQQVQQQQAIAAMAEMAPQIGQATKTMAEAQKISQEANPLGGL